MLYTHEAKLNYIDIRFDDYIEVPRKYFSGFGDNYFN